MIVNRPYTNGGNQMKNKTLATSVVAVGLFSLQVQADQPSVPDGNWFGDITSQCTMGDTFIDDLNLRNPNLEVTCSSGRCFAQLSYEVNNEDVIDQLENSIPGWGETGHRMTVVGWGPIRSRHIEDGNVVSSDDQISPDDSREQENVEAYLDGLTLVFLPNDDLSISIDHSHYNIRCTGIFLPKL
ncbi:MAG: hypothetical protein OXC65_06420 [Thiotrichales bacterium]|nr:hypothetical protein [Thiotrichales bacterium]